MRYREFHYRWEWQLEASPEALWPLLTDTNRFNQDARVPAVERRSSGMAMLSNRRRLLRLSRAGIGVEWEEEPFEWVRPHRFGVTRRYRSGPLAEMRVLAELPPRPGGGSRLVYQVWARPRTLLGLVAVPIQIGLLSARAFSKTFRRYDRLAVEGEAPLALPARVRLAPGAAARLTTLRESLVAQGAAPDLVAKLAEIVEQADDLTVARLRPYVLAEYWGVSRRAALELCLLATRVGLLDLRWDLLCPLCRGAERSSPTLQDIRADVHCESCNIDFTVNFDRSVEVTFRPNPAVRQVESREFCVGGPGVTPHIAVQQLLPPGAVRTLEAKLEPGRYRVRTLGLPGGQFVLVAADGPLEAALSATEAGWPPEELRLSPVPTVRFENETRSEQLFVLERTAWSDQAATAAEVTALQLFRDLFASEALRPGEQISVGSLTVLFTDLSESTRLYRDIGDAPAFGSVMSHFDVLREAIAEEEGALVKTIGDAVMAVFRRPAGGLRAVLAVQRRLASPPEGARPLFLKAGMHSGPCIAVALNDRLDYFGSTVNIAARVVGLSSGRDVVVSGAVRCDPEVADLLADAASGLCAEPVGTALKGFEDEHFELWRVARVSEPG